MQIYSSTRFVDAAISKGVSNHLEFLKLDANGIKAQGAKHFVPYLKKEKRELRLNVPREFDETLRLVIGTIEPLLPTTFSLFSLWQKIILQFF